MKINVRKLGKTQVIKSGITHADFQKVRAQALRERKASPEEGKVSVEILQFNQGPLRAQHD